MSLDHSSVGSSRVYGCDLSRCHQKTFHHTAPPSIEVNFTRLHRINGLYLQKKLYFSAILEDVDKSIVYAEASSVFILVDPKKVGH